MKLLVYLQCCSPRHAVTCATDLAVSSWRTSALNATIPLFRTGQQLNSTRRRPCPSFSRAVRPSRLHMSGSYSVCGLGRMELPGWSLLLLHHPLDHWFRRFSSWQVLPESCHTERTVTAGGLLCIPAAWPGSDRYVFHSGSRRSNSQMQTDCTLHRDSQTHWPSMSYGGNLANQYTAP